MDVKLDINTEEIAAKLHEAIISGTFKSIFEKAVKEEIDRINKGHWNENSIIQNVIQGHIRSTMEEVLRTEYKEQILAAIRSHISDERIEELAGEMAQRIKISNY